MFIELLEKEYQITLKDEKKAENIYSRLNATCDNSEYYRWSIDKISGENYITSFFPKVFYNKFYREQNIISIANSENILKYNEEKGVYEKKDLKQNMLKKLNMKDPNIHKNPDKIIDIIKMDKSVNPDLLNSKIDYINFKNGMFNVKTKTLESHSNEFYSTKQVQSNYDISKASIQNTKFEKYLHDSFHSQDVNTIQEWLGYCISNYMGGQKFCVLSGSGKNGKGTLIRIMSSFFEKEFISSVDLAKLTKQEYCARLYNKALNICADISDSYIQDSSMIKKLTGEDSIEAKELYSNPFSFVNTAKITFASNKLPQSSDKTHGFLRRLLIISCDKVVENKIDNLSQIIVDSELENIINWSLEGLYRLIENNFEFTQSDITKENVKIYKAQNDNIVSFIEEYCHITNDNSNIPKNEFMLLYKEYCKMNNFLSQSSRNLNLQMKEKGITELRTIVRSWKGIQWDVTIKEVIESYKLSNKVKEFDLKGHSKYNIDLVYSLKDEGINIYE